MRSSSMRLPSDLSPFGLAQYPRQLSATCKTFLVASSCACFGWSCSDPDLFIASFHDEIIEAPARTLNLTILGDSTCDETLRLPHAEISQSGDVIASRNGPFVPGETPLPEALPRGIALTFDLAVLNADGLQIGRGCVEQALPEDRGVTLQVELRSLTTCQTQPTSLDISILLDVSLDASIDDPSNTRLSGLVSQVLDDANGYPPDSSWTLITFGHDVIERVAPTHYSSVVRDSVEGLYTVHEGGPRLFDGVTKATAFARSRSLCGRQPALLVLASGPDLGSTSVFQDAQIGLYARAGDATDDLFTFAIGLSNEGTDALTELVPAEVGFVAGANSEAGLKTSLGQAATALQALIPAE